MALIICEKGNEEVDRKAEDNAAFQHLYNTALFIPEGIAAQTHNIKGTFYYTSSMDPLHVIASRNFALVHNAGGQKDASFTSHP